MSTESSEYPPQDPPPSQGGVMPKSSPLVDTAESEPSESQVANELDGQGESEVHEGTEGVQTGVLEDTEPTEESGRESDEPTFEQGAGETPDAPVLGGDAQAEAADDREPTFVDQAPATEGEPDESEDSDDQG